MGELISFAKAPLQEEIEEFNPEERTERLRHELRSRTEDVLRYLFPAGKVNGPHFEVGDVCGTPGKSLKITMSGEYRGLWRDFESGEGGDLISLWQKTKGQDFRAAVKDIETFFSLAPPAGYAPTPYQAPKTPPTAPGLPAGSWTYKNAKGDVIATVQRFDTEDGKKEFRPWDAVRHKAAMPDPRPLYNQPGILGAQRIVLVEGEKCADALIGLGIPATTAMGGSNTKVEKTDWTPLVGKDVVIWPDNDPAGQKYAHNVAQALQGRSTSVSTLEIPAGKSPKWDAADAVAEGFAVLKFVGSGRQTVCGVSLCDWTIDKAFQGKAQKRQWLVVNTIPMASVTLFCAMGDAGKGMLTLDLALKVATYWDETPPHMWPQSLGNWLHTFGSAVILTAEDDKEEVHRRLEGIDPGGRRYTTGDRLMIVPLPNAGGTFPLMEAGKDGKPVVTPDFLQLKAQLVAIPDLKLVVVDPLASFIMADVNADPAVGAFVTGQLAALATETGAAIVVCHHMGKTGKGNEIKGPEQARAAIRGTTALVDGVRNAFVLWPTEAERAKTVCRYMSVPWSYNRVFHGAVVKSNGPADRDVKTMVRNEYGLLEVVDHILKEMKMSNDLLKGVLVQDIAAAAAEKKPYTKTGRSNGVFTLKHVLSPELQPLSKRHLWQLIDELLTEGRIAQCVFTGSIPQFLDVPGGEIYAGSEEKIAKGAVKAQGENR